MNGRIRSCIPDLGRKELRSLILGKMGEGEKLAAKLTKARLGLEWRDDVLEDWCDSINVKKLADRRDELQWKAFDKTNERWGNDPSELELSPYREEFLIQTDAYDYMDERLHELLDKCGVPRGWYGVATPR